MEEQEARVRVIQAELDFALGAEETTEMLEPAERLTRSAIEYVMGDRTALARVRAALKEFEV
jgi:hypothetical protein